MANEIKRMTFEEWTSEGRRRFGPDEWDWQFVCPACGHVQAVSDFRQYKDLGATPDDARFNCIGRYKMKQGKKVKKAFGDGDKKNGPCDYTTGGLLNISPILVVTKDGKEHPVFDFAPSEVH